MAGAMHRRGEDGRTPSFRKEVSARKCNHRRRKRLRRPYERESLVGDAQAKRSGMTSDWQDYLASYRKVRNNLKRIFEFQARVPISNLQK
ncbi:hypothetical protein L2E82_30378 [Cichorium intybus]|uniref:Uncharacterized protein n=1 Tax=Cichorium intybus TaxID=13427 RepID=A0ACB9D078_CICIN|nr:hypothetical protein L2E82_30378 [Cichorium intybus]